MPAAKELGLAKALARETAHQGELRARQGDEYIPPPSTPSSLGAPLPPMLPAAASNESFYTISTASACLTADYGLFSGAVTVGTSVYFAPAFDGKGAGRGPTPGGDAGVLHTTEASFSTIALRNLTSSFIWFGGRGRRDYGGTAAVGTRVFFAPHFQDSVGVLDTVTTTFTTISTPLMGTSKYDGAIALGTQVYFTPCNQNNVGVLDAVTDTFRTISTLAAGVRGEGKYRGAGAAVTSSEGVSRVFFAPYNENNVGVLDTQEPMSFSTILLPGANPGVASYAAMYSGAAAVGNKVYFAPNTRNDVLVLDTDMLSLASLEQAKLLHARCPHVCTCAHDSHPPSHPPAKYTVRPALCGTRFGHITSEPSPSSAPSAPWASRSARPALQALLLWARHPRHLGSPLRRRKTPRPTRMNPTRMTPQTTRRTSR